MGTLSEKLKKNIKPVIGTVAIIILSLIMVSMYADTASSAWPDAREIKVSIRKLKKSQKELLTLFNEEANLKNIKLRFIADSKQFWIPQRDGKIETNVQKKIEQAAKLSGMTLSTLGKIRNSKTKDGIKSIEISIGAKTTVESLTRFVAEIYRMTPKFNWDRCSIRPDNINNPKKVYMTGTLQFICIEDPEIATLLLKESKQ